LREHDFRAGSTRRQAAGARLKKEAPDRMELVYYETALLP
jgi:hypothetical protein